MQGMDVSALDKASAVLADPNRWALFVDIDGTLLGMAATPDAVVVPAGLVQLLDSVVGGLGGAVAILTGRRIAEADRLFAPLKLAASGVHGTELRLERGGPIDTLSQEIPASVIQAMDNISRIASGILVEHKGSGVAVHYRNAPLARRALESEMAAIVAASSYDLVLREGRKVLEAVPLGYSKGTALTTLIVAASLQGAPPRHGGRRHRRRVRRSSWPNGSAAWPCALPASTTTGARRTSTASAACAPGSRRWRTGWRCKIRLAAGRLRAAPADERAPALRRSTCRPSCRRPRGRPTWQ